MLKIFEDMETFIENNSIPKSHIQQNGSKPSSFWFFSGYGESDNSKLNAFDNALVDAGIGNINLIQYSSILPKDISFRSHEKDIEPGSVTGYILARKNGTRSQLVSSGIGIASLKDYFVVFEAAIHGASEELKSKLIESIKEAVSQRNEEIEDVFIFVNEATIKKEFGTLISGLIFDPASYR